MYVRTYAKAASCDDTSTSYHLVSLMQRCDDDDDDDNDNDDVEA